MSAFNELAKQYATTKNAVDKEAREQLKALVAEATAGDDVDKIAMKIKALIKGYREGREDIKTDTEAVEDISAQVGPDLGHILNLSFMYMMQRDECDLNKTIVSIMSSNEGIENKSHMILNLVAAVWNGHPELDSPEKVMAYMQEHVDPQHWAALSPMLTQACNYYAKYGQEEHSTLKEEERPAQQVIDMFPPSLAKEYQDSNKIVWALRLALYGK